MKRLIPMSIVSYEFCYTPCYAAHRGLCPHWTTHPVTIIIKLMESHRSRIQCTLSHPEDYALFHVAMRMGAQCCLWDNFKGILILNNAPHTHFFGDSAKYFHGCNCNTQLSRIQQHWWCNAPLLNQWFANVWLCFSVEFRTRIINWHIRCKCCHWHTWNLISEFTTCFIVSCH